MTGSDLILPSATERTNGCGSSPSIVPSGVDATIAIVRPSGDQAGAPTFRSGLVILRGFAERDVSTSHRDES